MRLLRLFILSAISVLSSGCATGLFSQRLISQYSAIDTPIEAYVSAHTDGQGTVVLEYMTAGANKRKCWAKINFGKLKKNHVHELKSQYSIHKKPLPSSKKKRMDEIPIVDLRDHIELSSGRHMQYEEIHDFINRHRTEQMQVYVYPDSSYPLSIPYEDPFNKQSRIYNKEPRDLFIPISSYPQFVIRYPFALLGDMVMYPFYLLAPRWP